MSRHESAAVVQRDGTASHYALGVLLLAYILSFIDRNVMSILVGPIRESFAISDTQFGLLQGLAFSLFYTFCGLPIAAMADRGRRSRIIALGVVFWSAMTCACGFAKSFAALFLARMGVGVGEAALSPPAHSLLADYFSEQRLPMALAVFTLGITLGGGMAYMIGGWAYGAMAALQQSYAWLADFRPWQLTFIVVGLPGFAVALLVLGVREPARTGVVHAVEQQSPLQAAFAYVWPRRRLYFALFGSVSLLSVLGYGFMSWYVEFMLRSFGVERKVIGFQFGWLFIVFGSLGALAGGWLAGRLRRGGVADANMRLVLLVALAWWPAAVAAPLSGDARTALWLAAPSLFFLNAYFGVAIAALQLVTPNGLRAQVSALLLFMTNLLGLGLGPLLVGGFNDHLFGSDQALGQSLALLGGLCCPLAAAWVWRGLPAYRAALAERGSGLEQAG